MVSSPANSTFWARCLRDRRIALFIGCLASLSALAIAHGAQSFGGLDPCSLCYRQREVYWVVGTIAAIGFASQMWRPDRRMRRAFLVLVGAGFLVGAVVAGFHAGVEWKFWPGPATCTGSTIAKLQSIDGEGLLEALNGGARPASCDQAAWRLVGLSMAGWNAVFAVSLSIFCFTAAWTRPLLMDRSAADAPSMSKASP